MSFLDRYVAVVGKYMRAAERLDRRTLKGILQLVRDVKADVTARIASSDWERSRIESLLNRLRVTGEDLSRDLTRKMGAHAGTTYDIGGKVIDVVLRDFGGPDENLVRPLDRVQLAVLDKYSASLLTQLSNDAIDNVSNTIRLGMISGENPQDIIRKIGTGLVDSDGNPAPGVWGDVVRRAEVTYRTEGGRAYSVANQVRMAQHDAVRPGLKKRWLHSLKPAGRARPSHVRAEEDYSPGGDPGPIPQGEPFVLHVGADESSKSFPPGEYECMFPRDPSLPAAASILCVLPGTMVEGRFVGGLKAWYAGPAREIETRRGNRLSITPNHPVLTLRGWVAAGELRKGDHVVGRCSNIESTVDVADDAEARPSSVEQVFEALATHRGQLRANRRELNLDGDEVGLDPDVDVVGSYLELLSNVESGSAQSVRDVGFVSADVRHVDVSRFGNGDALSDWLLAPSVSSPHPGALPLNFRSVGSVPPPPEIASFGSAAEWNTTFGKLSRYSQSLHVEAPRKAEHALAGLVSRDNRAGVERGGTATNSYTGCTESIGDRLAFRAALHRENGSGRAGAVAVSQLSYPIADDSGTNLTRTDGDASAAEVTSEHAVVNLAFLRELIDASSGEVSLDEIVEIRDFDWRGHVFDFEASDGWIIAGGICISNCGCAVSPWREGWEGL